MLWEDYDSFRSLSSCRGHEKLPIIGLDRETSKPHPYSSLNLQGVKSLSHFGKLTKFPNINFQGPGIAPLGFA